MLVDALAAVRRAMLRAMRAVAFRLACAQGLGVMSLIGERHIAMYGALLEYKAHKLMTPHDFDVAMCLALSVSGDVRVRVFNHVEAQLVARDERIMAATVFAVSSSQFAAARFLAMNPDHLRTVPSFAIDFASIAADASPMGRVITLIAVTIHDFPLAVVHSPAETQQIAASTIRAAAAAAMLSLGYGASDDDDDDDDYGEFHDFRASPGV
jgi:hypothetical protein